MNNSQLDQRLLGDIPSTLTGIGLTNIIHTRINHCTSTSKGRGSLIDRVAERIMQIWHTESYKSAGSTFGG